METFSRAGLTFDVLAHGPEDGETAILLHGFPSNAESWRPVAERLAGAGYRVLVPNQRGYSPRAAPSRRGAYRLSELTADILGLIDASKAPTVHLVGHDWGGGVAWAVASAHPERIASLSVVSTPHPKALFKSFLTSRQMFLSWYFLLFQLPKLPEALVVANHGKTAVAWLKKAGLDEDLAREYTRRLARTPQTLTGAFHWYRAMPLDMPFTRKIGPISVPTMYVWSTNDVALGRAAAEATAKWVTGGYRFEVIEGASHWIPEEHPDQLADLLLTHLKPRP